MMRRKLLIAIIFALVLLLLLTAIIFVRVRNSGEPVPDEPVLNTSPVSVNEPAGQPAAQTEPAGQPVLESEPGRQDGERFEDVILLEGMETTVRYEHVRDNALGFDMDFDYELFERHRESDREYFVSIYDLPEHPENYLEVRYSSEDARIVAASIGETLSKDYDISREDAFQLERAGSCIRIDASADVGGLTMPDQLQMVYIIPAEDGCRIATAHYSIEAAEGFGRRFRYMMDTFSAIPRQGGERLTDKQAIAAIERYCRMSNPDLEKAANSGEYPVYWEIAWSDDQQIVVLFRSYTGAQIRYYIDPVSGNTHVTEFVPGITEKEEPTDESFNVRDYLT